MSRLNAPFWTLLLASAVGAAFAPADEPPPLPEQYAEVLLHVEGMI